MGLCFNQSKQKIQCQGNDTIILLIIAVGFLTVTANIAAYKGTSTKSMKNFMLS